jgi:hypothetical protein
MKPKPEHPGRWMLKLALAFLAASAGCKSSTRPEAIEDWRYIQTEVNFREILLRTSDQACAQFAEEREKERSALAAFFNSAEHPNSQGK